MKSRILRRVGFALTVWCAALAAHALDCADVYATATRNVRTNDRASAELKYNWERLCRKDGSLSGSETGAQLETRINQLPFKFGFNSNTIEQKASEFCRAGWTAMRRGSKNHGLHPRL